MKKVITLLAILGFVASANSFAGGKPVQKPAAQQGAVQAQKPVAQKPVVQAQKPVHEFLKKFHTRCTLKYQITGAHIVFWGAGAGEGKIGCINGFDGEDSRDVYLGEVNWGLGLGYFKESGVMELWGLGTTADVFAGLLAQIKAKAAWGDVGKAYGLSAGVLFGTNGADVVAGYSTADVTGYGAAVTIGVLGMIGKGDVSPAAQFQNGFEYRP